MIPELKISRSRRCCWPSLSHSRGKQCASRGGKRVAPLSCDVEEYDGPDMEALLWIVLPVLTAAGSAALALAQRKRLLRTAIQRGLAGGRSLDEIMREQGYC